MGAENEANDESFIDDVTSSEGTETTTQNGTKGEGTSGNPQGNEWQKAIAELAGHVKQVTAPKTEEKQPSPEEIEEYWKVYNPEKKNPEFFKKWLRVPADMDPTEAQALIAERKALFSEMQQGLMQQSVTATRRLLEQEMKKLREEYEPLRETISSQKSEKLRNSFNEKFPALADPKYNKILALSAGELANQDFKNEDEYFDALAKRAAKGLEELLGSPFDLGAANKNKPTVTTPRLPRTSAGGTGGSGGGRAVAKSTSDDDSDTLSFMQ